jgi:hypothetical protein
MRKPRSALILFMLLVLSLSLAVPAEDVLETTYDESETQPYEDVPLFSILLPLAAGGMTQAVLSGVRLRSGTAFPFVVTRSNGADAHQPTGCRVALALRCTFLC